jgi:hypothetical protein
MRTIDIQQAVEACRTAADLMLAAAAPEAGLSPVERRDLTAIATAIKALLEPRRPPAADPSTLPVLAPLELSR